MLDGADKTGLPEGPSDLSMERALLALALMDNAVLDRLGRLDGDDFADPLHAMVLEAMRDLRLADRPVNVVTMKDRVGAAVFADGSSVLDALKAFSIADVPPDAHDLAQAIRDKSLRRQIMLLGHDTSAAVWNEADSPSVIIAARMAELDKLLDKCRPEGQVQWTAHEAATDLTDFVLNPPADERIQTGIVDLDTSVGGLGRGELTFLAGRPGMGKTVLGVCIGKGAALAGHAVVIFSLEMRARAWMARMASDAAWGYKNPLAYSDALRGKLKGQREVDRLVKGAESRMHLPLIINERAGLSVPEMAAIVRQASQTFERQGKQLGLIIVDHVGKVKPDNYKGDRVREVGAISNALATLAKHENVAMLALCQLNRGVEGRPNNKRPVLSDLRDSGDLEQDADTVMFAYRHAYYLGQKEDDPDKEHARQSLLESCKHDLEIAIAKQRNGLTGSVRLFIDLASNAVRNRAVGNG